MEIEIIKNSPEALVVRISTYLSDKLIWTSKNSFGEWIKIVYHRGKCRVHREGK